MKTQEAELKIDEIRRYREEKEELGRFLSQRGMRLEAVASKIGSPYFDKFISALAAMGEMIERGADAAKTGDLELTGRILGAGAKVQKDAVYGVLIESMGGIRPILDQGINGHLALLRDYIMERYETGVTKCEVILAKAA